MKLLEDLWVLAPNDSSVIKAGVGNRNTSDSESDAIYAMVQCTPKLSPEECRRCLIETAQPIRSRWDVSRGVRMMNRNCNIQFELYSFYNENETRLKELQVFLPPEPPPPGKGDLLSPVLIFTSDFGKLEDAIASLICAVMQYSATRVIVLGYRCKFDLLIFEPQYCCCIVVSHFDIYNLQL